MHDYPRMIASTDQVEPVPRRVRATLAGRTVVDTTPDRAVRLHAAAAALLQAAGTGWLHAYVPTPAPDEDALRSLRSRIGEAAFEEARVQGAAMTPTEAVKYASSADPTA